jgi:hypothetical protein
MRGTIPRTDLFQKLVVSFPTKELHIFTRTDIHGVYRESVQNPVFHFQNKAEMDQFQSFIRERELLGNYVVGSVTTDRHVRTSGQILKVWRTEDDHPLLTFTVWVTEEDPQHHLEFDVASFASIKPMGENGVQLRVREEHSQNLGFQKMEINFDFKKGK